MELRQQNCLGWSLISTNGHCVTLGKLLPTAVLQYLQGLLPGWPNLWMLKSHV